MKIFKRKLLPTVITAVLMGTPGLAGAAAFVQCPEDTDGDGVPDTNVTLPDGRSVQCMHVTGGDGFIRMGDDSEVYIFSFADVTDVQQDQVLDLGVFRANFPAPTIVTKENEVLYLTLTNVGTFIRPDLFDPHTIHYHGFPDASDIFDGVPDSTVSINQQASITYWYNNVKPGTYIWHCHVEATEHMQMGMLGNLYVKPAQNELPNGTDLNGFTHVTGNEYVYNDEDGSTFYDVEIPIQLSAMDGDFHNASFTTQPLPFAAMVDQYPMMNGRGYPDTTNMLLTDPEKTAFPPPPDSTAVGHPQPLASKVKVTSGQKLLLRVSNVGVVHQYSITALGLPMKVVGRGARLLRGQGQAVGQNLFVDTNMVTLGGGEAVDIIIDTSDVAPGTYFLYTTDLNFLSNNEEDFGGMMTEIVVI